MFGITSPQMEAFDDLGASRLDAHMVQTIGNALPDLLREQSPDQRRQQLAAWVDKGCERAVDMGYEEEPDLAAFVTLQLAYTLMSANEQQKLREWTGDLLQRKSSSGQVRIALVQSTLSRLASTEPLAGRVHGILGRVRAAYA
jgi:hypothetical protein